MSVLFRQDDRLHAENYRLRAQLEKIQSEGYLCRLTALHDEELAKKERKIALLEKENLKLREQHSADLKKSRSLEFDLSMAELSMADFKAQLKQKYKEKSALLEQIAQCHLTIQAQIAGQDEIIQAQLADRDGVIQKLTAQINRDYTNSSIPSSLCMGHGTIHNGREKTGRKPGGHQKHPRKKQIANSQVNLEIPCACLSCAGKNLQPTGRSKTRQLIDLKVVVSATDFVSEEYRYEECGANFYAEFPSGLPNEVNYGPEVKSFSAFLNNYYNVSLDKTAETLWEMSGGAITIAKGTLSNLSKEFSTRVHP